ncbi:MULTISPECIES: phage tail assembly chaperone [unclassified Pseudomonas]|uniref:phage tail assembly chaperone n=1 Tax=unclassified Pseudomonas TaxID=196821 RepID=UPI0011AC7636|nr:MULTISPECIES: phage tail assembly chaperone [unclassified Pseudomonas]TWC06440.1 phage tail assembly chaperone [Pseudomonas sp. SJZ075]TWC25369.1 phage tail assembly chaperone [Pseudomonas sp. SJZ078]TWC44279.1 phage tail assembly chaperone [Pseudomonas sp. SJZ124]TWC79520.1 phage tail assembly chaperone [Pseudomonas sp. SJZ101]
MSKFFFCPETLGLYPGALYGNAIGKTCIEMSESEYRVLAGHALAIDGDGRPVLASALPLTLEQLEAGERAWRDSELNRMEWLIARHRDEVDSGLPTSLIAEQYSELLVWRQLLRDWPAAGRFPATDYRPAKPEWISQKNQ